MNAKPLFAPCVLLGIFVVGMQTATAGQIVNLDATMVSSAVPTGPVNVPLGPGTYDVRPVGIAGGRLFNAWSAFSFNSGCDGNGENCTQGFENEFEFQSASIPPTFVGDGNHYATDLQALSHAQGTTFTLAVAEVVHFGLNDCPQCLGDNRGGNSLAIDPVPEPATWLLLATGLVGLLGYGWRRRQCTE